MAVQVRCQINYSFPIFVFSFFNLEKKSDEAKEKKTNGAAEEHEETSDVSGLFNDENDNSVVGKEEITPKRNAQRSAKGKVTKYGEDEEDEDDESMIRGLSIDDDDNASNYMGSDSDTEKKIKKANAKPRQPKKMKTGLID